MGNNRKYNYAIEYKSVESLFFCRSFWLTKWNIYLIIFIVDDINIDSADNTTYDNNERQSVGREQNRREEDHKIHCENIILIETPKLTQILWYCLCVLYFITMPLWWLKMLS